MNRWKLKGGFGASLPGLFVVLAMAAALRDPYYLIGLVVVPLTVAWHCYACRFLGHETLAFEDVRQQLVDLGAKLGPNQVAHVKNCKIRCARCYEWVAFDAEANAAVLGVKMP